MSTESYKSKVQDYSRRIVEAQRPIRVLDSVKYRPALREAFFAAGASQLPLADSDYYQTQNPLNFDASKKLTDLRQLGLDIKREFGADDELGQLLFKISEEYRMLVEMLMVRGQPEFYKFSRRLYGSPQDRFFGTDATVLEQSQLLEKIIAPLELKSLGAEDPRTISSEDVVSQLQARFAQSFLRGRVEVKISDGIVADASAGADTIKIKQGKFFTARDVRIFEVHEGYVHVATTLNGKSQRCALFLSKGPPRVVSTQEGLAILMEIFTFATYPQRARAINDRVLAIAMVEDGADFLDVYRFQLERGFSEADAYRNTTRVFRGGPVTGGSPFTKDISYCRGFVENYNFIRAAVRHGYPEIIPFLFVGKTHVDDVPLLYRLHKEGIVDAPELLPQQFQDLNGLAVWMSFSNFLYAVDLDAVQQHFGSLFSKSL